MRQLPRVLLDAANMGPEWFAAPEGPHYSMLLHERVDILAAGTDDDWEARLFKMMDAECAGAKDSDDEAAT